VGLLAVLLGLTGSSKVEVGKAEVGDIVGHVEGAWHEDQAGGHEMYSFENLIRAVDTSFGEEEYPRGGQCCEDAYGLRYWESLKASGKDLCPAVRFYHDDNLQGMFAVLRNVSLVATSSRKNEWNTPFNDMHVSVSGDCPILNIPDMYSASVAPFLSRFHRVKDSSLRCSEWQNHTTIVIPWYDATNWWHFLELAMYPSFLYYSMAQPDLVTRDRHVHIMTLRWPAKLERNVRRGGVYPTWVFTTEVLERMYGPVRIVPQEPLAHDTCFRTLLWPTTSYRHLDIQKLLGMCSQNCFSPMFRALGEYVRSSFGIVNLPFPRQRRRKLVFMARSSKESWTKHQDARNIQGQEMFSRGLAQRCAEHGVDFEELHFFYEDMQTAMEQLQAVGRSDILVGVHGAGLATMVALPYTGQVIELRADSVNLHFEKLASLLGLSYNHIRIGGKFGESAVDRVWDAVENPTSVVGSKSGSTFGSAFRSRYTGASQPKSGSALFQSSKERSSFRQRVGRRRP